MYQLHLLGEFRLVHDGVPITGVGSQRQQSLLAYLALHSDGPQPRQHLSFLFWSDSSEVQAHLLVGKIRRVSASIATFVERSGTEDRPLVPANDSAMLLVEFENGAHGTIHVSAVALIGEPGLRQQTSVFGEAGTLETGLAWQGHYVRGARQGQEGVADLAIPAHLWPEDDESTPFVQRFFKLYQTQPVGTRLFVDAICEGHQDVPNFRDGLQVQKVIAAAVESHQNGRWVDVD